MKAETLRDLISGKHPPTDALWLSNPGLLKHSTQSIEKRAPRTRRGAPPTGWAGEMQLPPTREGCAVDSTQTYAERCRQPAACLLLRRWKTARGYRRRAGAGGRPAFRHRSVSTPCPLPPERPPRGAEIGAQPSGCAGHSATCTRVICVRRVRKQLSRPLARLSCAVWGSGWAFGTAPPRHGSGSGGARSSDRTC